MPMMSLMQPAWRRSWLLPAAAGAALTGSLAGCATDRLEATAPASVNLTGEWRLNPNLSDDLDKLGDADKDQPRSSGMGRRRGRAGPGGGTGPGGNSGLPPIGAGSNWNGSPDAGVSSNFMGAAPTFGAAGFDQPANPPPDGTPAGNAPDGAAPQGPATESGPPAGPSGSGSAQPRSGGAGGKSALSRALQAPDYLSIRQDGATLTVRFRAADGTPVEDQFKAGTQTTIAYGADSTAERSAGWRGPVFVVTTKAKKGGTREDDYALDEDGRLIVSTYVKGSRRGSIDVKRVYDRIKG